MECLFERRRYCQPQTSDLFSRRSCSTSDIPVVIMRESGPQLSQCILSCHVKCQMPQSRTDAYLNAVRADGSILTRQHLDSAASWPNLAVCANRKSHPGNDLEISKAVDATPRSGHHSNSSLLAAPSHVRGISEDHITNLPCQCTAGRIASCYDRSG